MVAFIEAEELADVIYNRVQRLQAQNKIFLDKLSEIDFDDNCDSKKIDLIKDLYTLSEKISSTFNHISYLTKDLVDEYERIYDKSYKVKESEELEREYDSIS